MEFSKILRSRLLIFFTPPGYSTMIFYFIYLNENSKALKFRINVPEESKEDILYFFSHRYLVFPPNLVFEIIRNMKHKDLTGETGTIFIFFPLVIILLFGPLVFLFYCSYAGLMGKNIEYSI